MTQARMTLKTKINAIQSLKQAGIEDVLSI